MVLELSLTHFSFKCLSEGPCFWVLQSFIHIQIITNKASITVSLRWYNIPPYLITSAMIIRGHYKIWFTRTSISSTNLHLKESILYQNFCYIHLQVFTLPLLTYFSETNINAYNKIWSFRIHFPQTLTIHILWITIVDTL